MKDIPRRINWETIAKAPIGDEVEVLTTAKNLQGLLSSVTQQYDKGELLNRLPVVKPSAIDSSKMVRLPLKEGGELYLGAVEEGRVKKPVIGFSGTRFGENEVFMSDISHAQADDELNSLKIYSHSSEAIRRCGSIETGSEIDWSQVDPKIAKDLRSIWK